MSCIYRDDVDKCYITSFDLIRLLEGIIGTVCNIDEKNRIRRNVHHIEHDTISKSKPYHEEFFDLLMSFPAPMPRRNVRDLKAFRWEYLPEALHAIIDKMVSRQSMHVTRPTSHIGSPFTLPRRWTTIHRPLAR